MTEGIASHTSSHEEMIRAFSAFLVEYEQLGGISQCTLKRKRGDHFLGNVSRVRDVYSVRVCVLKMIIITISSDTSRPIPITRTCKITY